MDINFIAVALATIAQFAFGAVWYMPVFGKVWGDIHGFNKLSKAEQKAAQSEMMPMLGLQLITTLVTTLVLAKLIVLLPDYSAYMLGIMVWIGFIVPTQVAAVIFGGTAPKWVLTKIAVMTGASLGCMLVASLILGSM